MNNASLDAGLGRGVPPQLDHIVEHADISVAKEHQLAVRVGRNFVRKPVSRSDVTARILC